MCSNHSCCCSCCARPIFCTCYCDPSLKKQGLTPAFGSLYSSDDSETGVVPNVAVDFDFPGPVYNTNPDIDTNSIFIFYDGVYEISASLNVSSESGPVEAQFQIRRNNIYIPGSLFQTTLNSSQTTISKTIQVHLAVGDTITLVPISGDEVGYSNAALTVNRIGK